MLVLIRASAVLIVIMAGCSNTATTDPVQELEAISAEFLKVATIVDLAAAYQPLPDGSLATLHQAERGWALPHRDAATSDIVGTDRHIDVLIETHGPALTKGRVAVPKTESDASRFRALLKAADVRIQKIFDDDSRQPVNLAAATLASTHYSPALKTHPAKSVLAIFDLKSGSLTRSDAGDSWHLVPRYLRNVCEDDFLYRKPTAAMGTACLIAPDVVLTVRHNLEPGLKNLLFVFGYEFSNESPLGFSTKFPSANVYRAIKVLEQGKGEYGDWAFLRLDRPVPPDALYAPAMISDDVEIATGTPVITYGYPHGIPLTSADDAQVRYISEDGSAFYADVDCSDGNSGGPVFDQRTGRIIGLVRAAVGRVNLVKVGGCIRTAPFNFNPLADQRLLPYGDEIVPVRSFVDAWRKITPQPRT